MWVVFNKIFFRSVSLLVVSALLQTLCATLLLSLNGYASFASLLFVSCQLISVVCLLHLPLPQIRKATFINKQTAPKLLIIVALLPFSYKAARSIMDGTPIHIQYADMLPIIGVMCQRFLSGRLSEVYAPIPEIWNGVQPIYLPALWLPFCASFLFHFDMRWTTLCGIWGSVLLCVLPKWRRPWLVPIFVFSILYLLYWLHTDPANHVIVLSEEGVVYFYYALLTASLFIGNAWLIGVTAALCLLSRYAFIGWLPFALAALLYKKEYPFLMKGLIAGTATAALLVLPFGTAFLRTQFNLPAQYVAHAGRVWADDPQHFTQSLGLAKFFGPQHTALQHSILVWGSFIVPLLFFTVINKKRFSVLNLLLAGLQLSLCFFYALVDVPYLYLFYTPVFVSLVIAGWALNAGRKVS